MTTASQLPVVVIGAGPVGLAAAAHQPWLRVKGRRPVMKKRHYLDEEIPAGPKATREAEKARTRSGHVTVRSGRRTFVAKQRS